MGKQRPFKIGDENGVRTDEIHEITREELTAITMDAFRTSPPAEREELQMMLQTVQHIAWGTWIAREDKGQLKCGCPLASISDWVSSEIFADHPGKPPSGAINLFDAVMTDRMGVGLGIVKVV